MKRYSGVTPEMGCCHSAGRPMRRSANPDRGMQMDSAVALVRTYLQINGYFVVTDYPVVELDRDGSARSMTDLDILAVRFPDAGRLVLDGNRSKIIGEIDPKLGHPGNCIDLIIGEVKQGAARLNRGAHDPSVMRAALARFGSVDQSRARAVVEELLRKGHASTPSGHNVRVMVFASYAYRSPGPGVRVVTLGHMKNFVTDYLRQYWDILH